VVMGMHKQVVLITGASSGVGFAAARRLTELGATIIMICRDAERGDAARRAIARVATGAAPALILADLSSQAAIRQVGDKIGEKFPRIDVLLNNAGAIFARRELSVDGIEKTLATNHLAPFLLTNLLLPLVEAAPQGRVITVSSESHTGSPSKLANILFAYELARRLKGSRVTSNSLSPGPTRTSFGSNMKGLPSLFPLLIKRIPFLFHGPTKLRKPTCTQLQRSNWRMLQAGSSCGAARQKRSASRTTRKWQRGSGKSAKASAPVP
jgi:retinol dehydrogenase 12